MKVKFFFFVLLKVIHSNLVTRGCVGGCHLEFVQCTTPVLLANNFIKNLNFFCSNDSHAADS